MFGFPFFTILISILLSIIILSLMIHKGFSDANKADKSRSTDSEKDTSGS
jgi:hypothetical protein